jgi:phage terminase large subunit-like protein
VRQPTVGGSRDRRAARQKSPAVDILERLIFQKRIRHSNHPMLAMNAASGIVTRDPAGGRRLDKAKSLGRIDGIVALAIAHSAAMIRPEPPMKFDVEALIA